MIPFKQVNYNVAHLIVELLYQNSLFFRLKRYKKLPQVKPPVKERCSSPLKCFFNFNPEFKKHFTEGYNESWFF